MKETEFEFYLRNTLESVVLAALHPRTSISVIVQVLSEDGSLLSTAINATCLALLDAGISLKSLIGSVTCAISADGTLLLDPDAKEEQVRI
jgi:exosome complex component RRP46